MSYELKDVQGAECIQLVDTTFPASAFTGLDVMALAGSGGGVNIQDGSDGRIAFPLARVQLEAAVAPNDGGS